MTHDFLWQKLYQDAMLELDRIKLQEKVDAAYEALQRRSQELILGAENVGDALTERQAITDALHGLRAIERLELGAAVASSGQRRNLAQEEAS